MCGQGRSRTLGRRSGSSGTSWSTSQTSCVLQILDAPVAQMVDKLTDAFRVMDQPIAEQVIAVPKISGLSCPSRASLREPQMAEHLMEVPTIVSYSFLQQLSVEQTVDIPVPHGGFACGGPPDFPPGHGPLKRTEEEIISVTHRVFWRSSRFSHRTFYSSWVLVEINKVFTLDRVRPRRTFTFQFPVVCPRTRTCLPPLSGCSSVTATRARPTTGTDALKRLSGSHRLASGWCGSARRAQGGRYTTGTRTPAPVVLLSFLCLLGDAVRDEGLGIPSPLLGCHSSSPLSLAVCSVSRC